jgi:class 3 adenylate cyclase/tetratricopeptide (TPR) repeat protein
MTSSTSAESRLTRLLDRLLTAAEASLAAGDLETARATAEEVRAVDSDNVRAEQVLRAVAARQQSASGERALMSLLFSDIVGSTMLSEQVEPEQLRDVFSFYRATAREAVERYGGYVMKYMGDGILAGFGFPDPHEDDGRRAVLAGLDLVAAMQAARADLQRRIGVAPEVRIGIHTGRVVVADLSDERSSDERDSIVGVAPNLAARIQQAAEPNTVVISDVTQNLVDTDFFLHSLGERDFKGISRPVEVFAVDRPRHAGARFDAERYRQAGLIGRDEPRDSLFAAWQRVRDGAEADASSSFLVVGEAGIGKTRLVAEILDHVESSGGRVLSAGCLPYYSNVSLWPVARTIERALDVVDEGTDRLARLVENLESLGLDPASSVPFLAPLIGVDATADYPAPELDPTAFLDETLNQLVAWVAAMAETSPYLLIVEDLHWADPSTVGLLGRLTERRPAGVLTVATTRDDSPIPWREAATGLHLRRLDNASALHLLQNLAVGRHLSDDVLATIIDRAEGVPLFIEELTHSHLDEARTEPMPVRLQELFTWRLKSPGVDLRIAQVAATLGPAFDPATLAAVVGDDPAVADQMLVLADAGIIERADPGGSTYRFRHALMRDAAYETQVLDVRSRTHAQIAEVISERGAEPALVAEHLDLAGDAPAASRHYLVAATAQQTRGAHTEATKLLTRALELLETLPESQDRDLAELTSRMLRALSVSSVQGYAAPDVQLDHRRAEALATRLGSRPEVLPSLIAIWAYWLTSGELPTARGLIERLTAMVRQAEFAWFEPEVQSCAGWQSFYEGRLTDSQHHLELAMQGFAARPSEQSVSPFWPLPNDPIAVSAIALACVSTLRGERTHAAAWEQQAVARTEQIGFPRGPWSEAFVLTYAAWIRRFLGDHDDARALGARVVGIGQEHGYAYWMLLGSSYYAAATPDDEPDREFLETNVATLHALGQQAFAPANLAYLAELYRAAGQVDRAAERVDEAIEMVHKSGEYVHLPVLLQLRATLALERWGDSAQAVGDLTESIRIATEQGARVARLRAALALARVPEPHRPSDWRAVLSAARDDLAEADSLPEATDADELL